MRKFYLLLLFTALFSSCQLEDDNLILDPEFTLDGTSALTSSLKNLTQNSTTFDNFIDGTSKVRIDLPFDVRVNDSIAFRLENTIDYQNLIDILEATPIKDEIELVFPLSVSGIDHVEFEVDSSNSFDELLDDLPESSEVNCLNLNYPISVRYYSSVTTQISNQSITSDAQLFNFLNNLISEGIFYEIQYPIVATTAEQTETVINSNDEFSALYSNLPNFCVNTVIYDNVESQINPDDPDEFRDYISSGVFSISDFTIDGNPITDFDSSEFTFDINGAIYNNGSLAGHWETSLVDSAILFALQFSDDSYNAIENEWYIMTLQEEAFDISFVNATGSISRSTLLKN